MWKLIIMIERAPDEEANRYRQPEEPEKNVAARCIVFDLDEQGYKSVRDIAEGPYVSQVVEIVDIWRDANLYIEHQDGTLEDLTPIFNFKQRRTRVKRLVRALEDRYKTGLQLFPPDTYKRGAHGRFA